MAILRVAKNRIDDERYADGESKAVLLRAVDRASKALPLTPALRVARLSSSRYYSWRQLEDEGLKRMLAQVDVTFSNSMIEAFWRSLKHSWLYLHSLESIESLRRLVEFYVRQHDEVMPHAAFEGQTPDEMY